jgi:hypothetical protein
MEEDNCPSNDFKVGQSQGKCWGDGHYRCKECLHYRADFKEFGQALIDYAHQIQGEIQIIPL